jgi:hypothetical protein
MSYIGLSILVNNYDGVNRGMERKKLLKNETRRILSLLDDRPFDEENIRMGKQGRPFFPCREADFNISYSENMAAVSFVKGKSLRTGCDVELIRPRQLAKKIAEDYFTAPERDFIFNTEYDEAKFFMIWTLKECYLKLKGMSVFDMKKVPSFIFNDDSSGAFIFGAAVSVPLSFYLYELSGFGERYILASAIEGENFAGSGAFGVLDSLPEIKWFSQTSLTCKSIAKIKAAPSPERTVSPNM